MVKPSREIDQDFHGALLPLVESYYTAMELNRSIWDLALELSSLHHLGVSDSQLRYVICRGFVEHRFETGSSDQTERTFSAPMFLRFSANSCFVLTEAGRRAAKQASHQHLPAMITGKRAGNTPFYDADKRILFFAGETVKRYRVPAENQELILMAFEEEKWPPHISDPLPGKAGTSAKRRLSDAIKNLNGNQHKRRVRFRGDGRGVGVVWEALP
jgi:hypothetical protein